MKTRLLFLLLLLATMVACDPPESISYDGDAIRPSPGEPHEPMGGSSPVPAALSLLILGTMFTAAAYALTGGNERWMTNE